MRQDKMVNPLQNKHFSAGLSSAAIPGSHVKNLQKEFLVL